MKTINFNSYSSMILLGLLLAVTPHAYGKVENPLHGVKDRKVIPVTQNPFSFENDATVIKKKDAREEALNGVGRVNSDQPNFLVIEKPTKNEENMTKILEDVIKTAETHGKPTKPAEGEFPALDLIAQDPGAFLDGDWERGKVNLTYQGKVGSGIYTKGQIKGEDGSNFWFGSVTFKTGAGTKTQTILTSEDGGTFLYRQVNQEGSKINTTSVKIAKFVKNGKEHINFLVVESKDGGQPIYNGSYGVLVKKDVDPETGRPIEVYEAYGCRLGFTHIIIVYEGDLPQTIIFAGKVSIQEVRPGDSVLYYEAEAKYTIETVEATNLPYKFPLSPIGLTAAVKE